MSRPAGLPERLRQLREARRLSQKEIAATVGGSQRAWADYEAGRTAPGAAVLAGLAEQGADLHWLLLGDGAMMRGTRAGLDEELLRDVIRRIEVMLAERGIALDSDKKALVIKEVYMETAARLAAGDEGRAASDDLVARFVRLAS